MLTDYYKFVVIYIIIVRIPLLSIRYYIYSKMFQNSYQNGTYFELFDPKGIAPLI